jgi:hypothetical protein
MAPIIGIDTGITMLMAKRSISFVWDVMKNPEAQRDGKAVLTYEAPSSL